MTCLSWYLPLLAQHRLGAEWYAANWGYVAAAEVVTYLLLVLVFMQRFVLTLHVTAHRRLFKKEYSLGNMYNEVVLAPFFGIPPGFYYLHHICMHHVENNVFPYDISSTMPHQRDSWLGLLSYIGRYITHSLLYLPYYAWSKGRYKLMFYALGMTTSFLTAITLSYNINPVGTVTTMIVPFFACAVLLMQGNFTQHMFINPEIPFDNYGLAFNTCNAPFNQLTYNDGYHIIHHLNSRLHWLDVPQWFEDNIEKFAETDSLLFQQLENNDVWALVFTGQYEKLYKYWVQLTPQKRSVAEFEALLKARMIPLEGEPERYKKMRELKKQAKYVPGQKR